MLGLMVLLLPSAAANSVSPAPPARGDAAHLEGVERQDLGPTTSAWIVGSDGERSLQIGSSRLTPSSWRVSVTVLPWGDYAEAELGLDGEMLLGELVDAGVVQDGRADPRAFEAFARDNGLKIHNVNERAQVQEIWVQNRCPEAVAITVGSQSGREPSANASFELGSDTWSAVKGNRGDALCLPGRAACVEVHPGLQTVSVSPDCGSLGVPAF